MFRDALADSARNECAARDAELDGTVKENIIRKLKE